MPSHAAEPVAVLIISAMITPALLILGSGSLVATALVRLARAIDRSRMVALTSTEDANRLGWTSEKVSAWQNRYGRRAMLAEQSVASLFAAIGLFILGCLSIAVDYRVGDSLTWLPVGLTIAGMLAMLFGAFLMVAECRLASRQIREEVACLGTAVPLD